MIRTEIAASRSRAISLPPNEAKVMHPLESGAQAHWNAATARMIRRLFRAAVVFLLIFGAALSARGLVPALLHLPYEYSDPVRAQVVESRFEDVPGWQGLFRSRAVFSYRYVHQGRLFRSSAYRPAGKRAEAVRRYVPGLVIDAFVDPDHSTRAMVKPGMTGSDMALTLLGLMSLLMGGALLRRTCCRPIQGLPDSSGYRARSGQAPRD